MDRIETKRARCVCVGGGHWGPAACYLQRVTIYSYSHNSWLMVYPQARKIHRFWIDYVFVCVFFSTVSPVVCISHDSRVRLGLDS